MVRHYQAAEGQRNGAMWARGVAGSSLDTQPGAKTFGGLEGGGGRQTVSLLVPSMTVKLWSA